MDRDPIILGVVAFEDLIDKIARFDSFVIGGRVYSSELLTPQLIIQAADLVTDAATCGAQVLYWGVEAARARRFVAQVDAAYRSWRDRAFLDAKATPAEGSGKFPSDAVASSLYRQRPEYGDWQGRKATAQEGAEMAEAILEAFRLKAQLIRVAEQTLRDEAGGPYRVAEEPPARIARRPQTAG